jgi:hypothetical protein
MSSVLLFQGDPGSVVGLVASPGGTAATISVVSAIKAGGQEAFDGGLNRLFENFAVILTDISIEEVANANAMYAADGRIYMHVPGDKLGALTLSGIAFAGVCGAPSAGATPKKPGLVSMLEWYREHRVSNPASQPILVTLANSTTLEGYLGSFSSRVMNIVHQIHSFTLPMYLVPGDVNDALAGDINDISSGD